MFSWMFKVAVQIRAKRTALGYWALLTGYPWHLSFSSFIRRENWRHPQETNGEGRKGQGLFCRHQTDLPVTSGKIVLKDPWEETKNVSRNDDRAHAPRIDFSRHRRSADRDGSGNRSPAKRHSDGGGEFGLRMRGGEDASWSACRNPEQHSAGADDHRFCGPGSRGHRGSPQPFCWVSTLFSLHRHSARWPTRLHDGAPRHRNEQPGDDCIGVDARVRSAL